MKKIIFISQPINERIKNIQKNQFDFHNFIFKFSKIYSGNVILCLHPEEKRISKIIKKNINSKNITFLVGTKKVFKIKNSVFVGMFSTELIKACLLGKKIVIFEIDKKITKNFILKRLNLCDVVKTSEELKTLIMKNRLKKISLNLSRNKFSFLKGSNARLESYLN